MQLLGQEPTVGTLVGALVGAWLGADEGTCVGSRVGALVGAYVGFGRCLRMLVVTLGACVIVELTVTLRPTAEAKLLRVWVKAPEEELWTKLLPMSVMFALEELAWIEKSTETPLPDRRALRSEIDRMKTLSCGTPLEALIVFRSTVLSSSPKSSEERPSKDRDDSMTSTSLLPSSVGVGAGVGRVGAAVGFAVGALVGPEVGASVGSIVGALVGPAEVGCLVGCPRTQGSVAAKVGATVGEVVGACEGA